MWTAHNEPYFIPAWCETPDPCTNTITPETSYEAEDLGNPGVMHSYVVRALNGCEDPNVWSTHMGVFAFELVPGE